MPSLRQGEGAELEIDEAGFLSFLRTLPVAELDEQERDEKASRAN